MKYQKAQNKKGFTLLFAVVVSIIILSVGASIITIALKQVILSGVGRESQFAFYAANTGIECAIYWDLNYDVFAESQDLEFGENLSSATCANTKLEDGDLIAGDINLPSGEDAIENKFSLNLGNDRCVDVIVTKILELGGAGVASTTVESRGYNTCNINSPRRTERGLRISY